MLTANDVGDLGKAQVLGQLAEALPDGAVEDHHHEEERDEQKRCRDFAALAELVGAEAAGGRGAAQRAIRRAVAEPAVVVPGKNLRIRTTMTTTTTTTTNKKRK